MRQPPHTKVFYFRQTFGSQLSHLLMPLYSQRAPRSDQADIVPARPNSPFYLNPKAISDLSLLYATLEQKDKVMEDGTRVRRYFDSPPLGYSTGLWTRNSRTTYLEISSPHFASEFELDFESAESTLFSTLTQKSCAIQAIAPRILMGSSGSIREKL